MTRLLLITSLPIRLAPRHTKGSLPYELLASEEVSMMSELTKQIDNFEITLCAVALSERSKADKDILQLSSFVRKLSRKIDESEDDVEALYVS